MELSNTYKRLIFDEALNGRDQSFMQLALASLMRSDCKFDDEDRELLRTVLIRIAGSPAALNVACGVANKRGGKKNGVKAFRLANRVVYEVARGSNVESAWATVAAKNEVSFDAVKKAWMEWKSKLENLTSAHMGDWEVETQEPFESAIGETKEQFLNGIFKRKSKGRPKKANK